MLRKILSIFLLGYLSIPSVMFANPGNQNSSEGANNSQDEYHKGYKEGYAIAFAATSKCNEAYDWQWSGAQDYGAGFEAGIDEGHAAGMEACYEDSRDAGYSDGVNDSNGGLEYDEGRDYEDTYHHKAYTTGYYGGYDDFAYTVATDVDTVSADVSNESASEAMAIILENEEQDRESNAVTYFIGAIVVMVGIIFIYRRLRKLNE